MKRLSRLSIIRWPKSICGSRRTFGKMRFGARLRPRKGNMKARYAKNSLGSDIGIPLQFPKAPAGWRWRVQRGSADNDGRFIHQYSISTAAYAQGGAGVSVEMSKGMTYYPHSDRKPYQEGSLGYPAVGGHSHAEPCRASRP